MKKALCLMLVLLLLIPTFIFAEDPPAPAPSSSFKVDVDGTKTVNAIPGQTVSIRVGVAVYEEVYTNRLISATADINDPHIYLNNGFDSASSNSVASYPVYLNFSATVDKKAKPGTYPVQIVVSVDNQPAATYSAYIRVLKDPASQASSTPFLEMSEVDVKPSASNVEPGGRVVAGIAVTNPSEEPIYNAEIRIEGMDKDSFTLAKDFNAKTIPVIHPKETRRAVFELVASERVKPGNYPFEMSITYNGAKEDTSNKRSFYLTVKKSSDKASALVIKNLSSPSRSLLPGKTATIGFDLTNRGKSDATRVMIKSNIEGAGLVSKSISQFYEPNIAPGQTKHYEFTYLATQASETQNYPITFKVEYRDALNSEELQSAEQVTGLFVMNPTKDQKEGKNSTPKLIVDRYSFDPKLPEAGKEFEMKLSFRNTNSVKAVKNIKISLSSDASTASDSNSGGSNIFTPVDSSNTFFIDHIAPGDAVEKSIRLYTVPDAPAKTYNVMANFEYEDSENNEYKATEMIGIPVIQSSKLEVGEIQTMDTFEAGMGTNLACSFFNTGKVTLYNMMVKFESDELEAQNSTLYIGNFQVGATENYEIMINAMEPGEKKGTIVFSYEDSTGEKQEVRKELTFQVTEPMQMPPEGFESSEPMDEGSNFFSDLIGKWYFWVGTGVVLLGAGAIVRKVIRKKKEKGLELDE
ncbi:COG1361 S-layer family protein [Guggenheimella bovis]